MSWRCGGKASACYRAVWYRVVCCSMVLCGVFGGKPGGHIGVDKAPAEHIYTDNWCEDLGSLKKWEMERHQNWTAM